MELYAISIFGILVLSVLVVGTLLQGAKKNSSSRKLVIFIVSAIFYLLINLLCDLFGNKPGHDTFLYVVNALAFIGVDVVTICFNNYLYSLFETSTSKKYKSKIVVPIASLVDVILITVLTITGLLFEIKDGVYIEKPGSIAPYIITACQLIYYIFILIYFKKKCSKRQFVVMLIYILLPIIPMIIELNTNLYFITGISTTISTLMVYVLMQDTTIVHGKLRESVLKEITSTDLLTGLNNRRSYYSFIAKLKNNPTVGVMFCDLNGLKYTNDHFGHLKGDELIKQFADILAYKFNEKAFRISGDEFVVVLPDINEKDFKELSTSFDKELKEVHNNIAAIGYAFGAGSLVERLMMEAEEKMYIDKKATKAER